MMTVIKEKEKKKDINGYTIRVKTVPCVRATVGIKKYNKKIRQREHVHLEIRDSGMFVRQKLKWKSPPPPTGWVVSLRHAPPARPRGLRAINRVPCTLLPLGAQITFYPDITERRSPSCVHAHVRVINNLIYYQIVWSVLKYDVTASA